MPLPKEMWPPVRVSAPICLFRPTDRKQPVGLQEEEGRMLCGEREGKSMLMEVETHKHCSQAHHRRTHTWEVPGEPVRVPPYPGFGPHHFPSLGCGGQGPKWTPVQGLPCVSSSLSFKRHRKQALAMTDWLPPGTMPRWPHKSFPAPLVFPTFVPIAVSGPCPFKTLIASVICQALHV